MVIIQQTQRLIRLSWIVMFIAISVFGLGAQVTSVRAEAKPFLSNSKNHILPSHSEKPISPFEENTRLSDESTTGETGTITGHVFKSDGTTIITDLVVNVNAYRSTEYSISLVVTVDVSQVDGSYSITGLEPGDYKISAYSVGSKAYALEFYDNHYDDWEASVIHVNSGQTVTGIDFSLEEAGAISGHVFKADGKSVITDQVFWIHANCSTCDFIFPVQSSQVDGSFRIVGLAPGMYFMGVDTDQPSDYLTTYYNGVFDSDAATLIQVLPGQETQEINFSMQKGASISGNLVSANGLKPIAYPEIYVRANDVSDSYFGRSSSVSPSTGNYVIQGLRPGTYRIQANSYNKPDYVSKYYDNTLDPDQATLITVSLGQTITGKNFVLEEALGSISGQIIQDEGNCAPKETVFYIEVYTPSGSIVSSTSVWSTNSRFTLPRITPGIYKVKVYPVNDWGYVSNYYGNASDLNNAAPVTVTAGQTTSGIDVTLHTTTGCIAGYVFKADGTGVITDQKIFIKDNNSNSSGAQVSQVDGSYLLNALAPGNYKVQAGPDLTNPGYIPRYYSNTYEYDQAAWVSVTAGAATSGINIDLERSGSISGHVIKADGTSVIQDQVIQVKAESGVYYYCNCTGQVSQTDGSYTISNLLPGNYRILANSGNASGYISRYYKDTYDQTQVTYVAVTAAHQTTGIDIHLESPGSISGYVLAANSLNVISDQDMMVGVETLTGWLVESAPISRIDGSYTVSGLIPGNYLVRANYNYGSRDYLSNYYVNTNDRNQATPVSVNDGQTTTGIDFLLETHNGIIKGYVFKSDGVSVITDQVIQVDAVASGSIWQSAEVSQIDGSYTISGLWPGTYRIMANYNQRADGYLPSYYNNASDYEHATPVNVATSAPTTGIDFKLNSTGTISGRVNLIGKDQIFTGYKVYVQAQSTSGTYNASAEVSQIDGGYKITGLNPGTYRVKVNGDSFYESKYYNNVIDQSLATVVSVIPAHTTSGIDFNVKTTVGSISGYVYKSDGQGVIKDAEIRLILRKIDGSYATNTVASQSDGSFSFLCLSPGTYFVVANSEFALGYDRKYYQNAYQLGEATYIQVSAGNTTAGININLGPGGGVSGKVTRKDGVTPIGNARVNIYLSSAPDAPEYTWGYSNSDGTYSVTGLPVGTVTIKVTPQNFGQPISFLEAWYANGGSVAERSKASPVAVTTGVKTANINIALEQGGTGSITGFVKKADGIGVIADQIIEVKALATTGNTEVVTQASPLDGSFTISGLTPGSYKVLANSNLAPAYEVQYYYHSKDLSSANSVTVYGGYTTSGIGFSLAVLPPGSISGHVLQAGGMNVIQDQVLWVGVGSKVGSVIASVPVSQVDGSYTLPNLAPGTYVVAANSKNAPGYSSKYYDNTTDQTKVTLVTVASGLATSGIDFTLEPTTGTISGTVFKADGKSIITDQILRVGIYTPAGALVKNGTVSQVTGRFTISGLAPGSYRVSANDTAVPSYVTKHYPDSITLTQSTLVTVTAGQAVTGIDFNLESAGSLSGVVYQKDRLTPFSGVCLRISNSAPPWTQTSQVIDLAPTGADGKFSVRGLAVGDQFIQLDPSCAGTNSGNPEWVVPSGTNVDSSQALPVKISAAPTLLKIYYGDAKPEYRVMLPALIK